MKLKNTIALVTLMLSLGASTKQALSDDGKVTFGDSDHFLDELMMLPKVVNSLKGVREELYNATLGDRAELIKYISEELQIVIENKDIDNIVRDAELFINAGQNLFSSVLKYIQSDKLKGPKPLSAKPIIEKLDPPEPAKKPAVKKATKSK